MAFLLAVLEPTALVVFQHAMLAAEMSRAEAAVANNTLCGFLAVFECAADFLGRHAAADGEGEVDGGGRMDVQR